MGTCDCALSKVRARVTDEVCTSVYKCACVRARGGVYTVCSSMSLGSGGRVITGSNLMRKWNIHERHVALKTKLGASRKKKKKSQTAIRSDRVADWHFAK